MFLMYVDESGDTGLPTAGSPTCFYCLSGLVVHELYWQTAHRQLVTFRQRLSQQYRVHLEDELHSAELIRLSTDLAPSLRALRKHEWLSSLRQHADEIAAIPGFSIINVVVDKATGKQQHADEVFKFAWYRLFQRFENTIALRNFPGANYDLEERGMVFPDSTHAVALGKHLLTCGSQIGLKSKDHREVFRTSTGLSPKSSRSRSREILGTHFSSKQPTVQCFCSNSLSSLMGI